MTSQEHGKNGVFLIQLTPRGRHEMFVDVKMNINLLPGGTSLPQISCLRTFKMEEQEDGASLRAFVETTLEISLLHQEILQ